MDGLICSVRFTSQSAMSSLVGISLTEENLGIHEIQCVITIREN